jgi:hypothetical protein
MIDPRHHLQSASTPSAVTRRVLRQLPEPRRTPPQIQDSLVAELLALLRTTGTLRMLGTQVEAPGPVRSPAAAVLVGLILARLCGRLPEISTACAIVTQDLGGGARALLGMADTAASAGPGQVRDPWAEERSERQLFLTWAAITGHLRTDAPTLRQAFGEALPPRPAAAECVADMVWLTPERETAARQVINILMGRAG